MDALLIGVQQITAADDDTPSPVVEHEPGTLQGATAGGFPGLPAATREVSTAFAAAGPFMLSNRLSRNITECGCCAPSSLFFS